MELFPTIVSRAITIDVISPGMLGSQIGTLQLVICKNFLLQFSWRVLFTVFLSELLFWQMYEELQVLSPLVPTRQIYFLRFCQQIEQGAWVIVDVSYDLPHQEKQFASSSKAHRLPSGCLIQDMANGYSKVEY